MCKVMDSVFKNFRDLKWLRIELSYVYHTPLGKKSSESEHWWGILGSQSRYLQSEYNSRRWDRRSLISTKRQVQTKEKKSLLIFVFNFALQIKPLKSILDWGEPCILLQVTFCLTLSLQYEYILVVPVHLEICLAENTEIILEDVILQRWRILMILLYRCSGLQQWSNRICVLLSETFLHTHILLASLCSWLWTISPFHQASFLSFSLNIKVHMWYSDVVVIAQILLVSNWTHDLSFKSDLVPMFPVSVRGITTCSTAQSETLPRNGCLPLASP